MHQFICEVKDGQLVPIHSNKKKLLNQIIERSENLNIKLKVSLEEVHKDINNSQVKLYKAFILKASEHFGNTYEEMQFLLKRFIPLNIKGSPKPVDRWSSQELDNFISQSTALLGDFGFEF